MENTAQKYPTLTTEELPHSSSVLVAGAASGIGSFLCEDLLNLKCRVFGIDNLSTGSKENLENILTNNNFTFLQEDLNGRDFRFSGKVDYIFHLAGIEEYLSGQDLSLETLLVNAVGTTNLLDVAKENNAKFELISSYQNKDVREKDGRLYSHHEAKKYAEAIVTQYYKKYGLNARIVRLADVYGPRMNINTGTPLGKIFKDASSGEVLYLPGDGLITLRPTYVSDVVWGMEKAIFGQNTKGFVYNLVNSEKTSLLSFAHQVREVLAANAKIVFVKDKDYYQQLSLPEEVPVAKEIGWKVRVGFKEGIEKTLNYFTKHQNSLVAENIKEPIKKVNLIDKNDKKIRISLKLPGKIFLFVFVLLFLFLVYPAISLLVSASSLKNNLSSLEQQMKKQDMQKSKKTASGIAGTLGSINKNLNFYKPLFQITDREETFSETQKAILAGKMGADALTHLTISGQNFNLALKNILNPELEGGLGLSLGLAREELKTAQEELSLVQSQLSTINFNKILGFGSLPKNLNEKLTKFNDYRMILSKLNSLSGVFPDLIGLTGKKNYLLLFTNNSEIRPAGGFIGSYGLITFENGKMAGLKIDDVYNADGQLTGHIEPPGPIKQHLEQPHWYMRDSNWSPDFLESGQKAAWFLEKEIGRKVDGVVLIDLNILKELLALFGSINLPDYQDIITADNIFQKATYYSQENFFAGSTGKKDFLSALSTRLIDTMMNQASSLGPQVLLSLYKAAEEKHLAFYFNDEATENLMTQFNWGGRTAGDLCGDTSGCLNDYLQVVDANLGVNKANFFVKRKINQKIFIGEDLFVKERLDISYENTSQENTKYGGVYKNYLRLYLPLGSSIIKIQENDRDKVFKLDTTQELGKDVYGFLVEVNPQSTKTISVSYDLPHKFYWEKSGVYKLVVQKQLGAQNDPYILEMIYPQEWKTNSPTKFNGALDGDKVFQYSYHL